MDFNFTDTSLVSRFGEFNIRVYQEPAGRETVVLWSKTPPLKEPVLTRVHSECLTGDVFGSLHCDCGQQLAKSLRLLRKEGGIFIYLRQEGRGIGLFEKIKTYRLQSLGNDTFEANLLLGHNPDTRSYGMVKRVLQDLNVKTIRLLTNNPSKVADIASLGIEISSVVSLTITPCKHNRYYLRTKRDKFLHFRPGTQEKYQYQFYASNPECIGEIAVFLQKHTFDPLLNICAAISLNHNGLYNQQTLGEATAIIKACQKSRIVHPVLHFSFLHTEDYQTDLAALQKKIHGFEQLQLNDFDLAKLASFDWTVFSKELAISLSTSQLGLITKSNIKQTIKKNRFLVVLDDSKGTGKRCDFDQLRTQVELLLKHGIHRIGIAGGFGPDSLEEYFRLKRFYRINFSVDSETGVKTGLQTDPNKVELYLSQLLRNDTPKEEGIQQTRNFLHQNRRTGWETTCINGHSFQIHSNVFHAGLFPSTAWFAKEISPLLRKATSFCEVGCGAGVITCLAALANPSLTVVATDLNHDASENTRLNAQLLGLSKRIAIRQGDVLDSLQPQERFDLIFWALPFGFLDPGAQISLEEAQVFDPGYRAIRKLLQTAKNHLHPRGKLLLGFSSDLGHIDLLQHLVNEANASMQIVAKTTIQEEASLKFELLEVSYEQQ